MNRFFTVLLFILSITTLRSNAQDLIVSAEGDSLNCTIISQNPKSIHFFYKESNEIITRELPIDLFRTVLVGFYKLDKKQQEALRSKNAAGNISPVFNNDPTAISGSKEANALPVAEVPKDVIAKEERMVQSVIEHQNVKEDSAGITDTQEVKVSVNKALKPTVPFSKWYLEVRAGYANRLFHTGNKFPVDYTNYLKKLKSGYSFGVSGDYFFWKQTGLGLNIDIYKSSARMEDKSREDDVTIKYIGPSVVHRNFSQNPKNVIYTTFTMGYQTFVNKGREAADEFKLKGHALGWGGSVGIDFRIRQRAALGIAASCLIGTVFKLTKEIDGQRQIITLTTDKFEQLSRFALTVGLKFL